jgi:hypothetical protein
MLDHVCAEIHLEPGEALVHASRFSTCVGQAVITRIQ